MALADVTVTVHVCYEVRLYRTHYGRERARLDLITESLGRRTRTTLIRATPTAAYCDRWKP